MKKKNLAIITIKNLAISTLLLCNVATNATNFELSLGESKFTPTANGIWYQEGFPHSLNMKSGSGGFGITDKFSSKYRYVDGLKWRLGYEYLGHVYSDALATPSDANYNTSTHACNGPCWPLSRWIGSGSVQGIYGSVLPSWKLGPGDVFVELGVYVYRTQWKMRVYGWEACATCARADVYVNSPVQLNVYPFIGTGYTINKTTLAFSIYRNDIQGQGQVNVFPSQYPPIWNPYTYNVSIRQEF